MMSKGHDHIDVETGEFRRQFRQPIVIPVGRSIFNGDVLALGLAKAAQARAQRFDPAGLIATSLGNQKTDPRDLPLLLSEGRERCGKHTHAQCKYEMSTRNQSIASSDLIISALSDARPELEKQTLGRCSWGVKGSWADGQSPAKGFSMTRLCPSIHPCAFNSAPNVPNQRRSAS